MTAGLAVTMLSMGTTLTLKVMSVYEVKMCNSTGSSRIDTSLMQDFTGVMKVPGLVILGAVLQYTIMPMMGFVVSRFAGLSSPLAVG